LISSNNLIRYKCFGSRISMICDFDIMLIALNVQINH
jgi:hypothetical protein